MATHDAIINQMRKAIPILRGAGDVICDQNRGVYGPEVKRVKLRFIFSGGRQGPVAYRAMSVAVILVTFVSLLFVGIAGLTQMVVSKMSRSGTTRSSRSMCDQRRRPELQRDRGDQRRASMPCQKPASAEMIALRGNRLRGDREEAYENFSRLNGQRRAHAVDHAGYAPVRVPYRWSTPMKAHENEIQDSLCLVVTV